MTAQAPVLCGGVEAKLAVLRRELVQIRFPFVFDEDAAKLGKPAAFLPVINFLLHNFSSFVTKLSVEGGLVSRRSRRYVEGVLKLARERFRMRVGLSPSQFMSEGYAERKLTLLHHLISACREHHSSSFRQQQMKTLFDTNARKKQEAAHKEVQGARVAEENSCEAREEKEEPAQPSTARQQSPTPAPILSQPTPPFSLFLEEDEAEDPIPNADQPRPLPHALLGGAADAYRRSQETATEPQNSRSGGPADEFLPRSSRGCASDASSWRTAGLLESLPSLFQDSRAMQSRMSRLEEAVESSRKYNVALQTASSAHLRVLEGRVLSLERQSSACGPSAKQQQEQQQQQQQQQWRSSVTPSYGASGASRYSFAQETATAAVSAAPLAARNSPHNFGPSTFGLGPQDNNAVPRCDEPVALADQYKNSHFRQHQAEATLHLVASPQNAAWGSPHEGCINPLFGASPSSLPPQQPYQQFKPPASHNEDLFSCSNGENQPPQSPACRLKRPGPSAGRNEAPSSSSVLAALQARLAEVNIVLGEVRATLV